ncbi:hypothetical protein PN481_11010 [Nodularia spumigena CS-588/06]|nr:hypothetical protein [Nodularia spumigena CS-591/07A]MDB9344032.1 hypothetical protein [Nodularia spumigena CS-588/06]
MERLYKGSEKRILKFGRCLIGFAVGQQKTPAPMVLGFFMLCTNVKNLFHLHG